MNPQARSNYDTLPADGFMRLWQILGDPKATPPVAPLIPVSKTAWWKGIQEGRFPAPIKLAPRVSAWRVADIRKLIDEA